jgi:MFS family permease
MAASLVVPRLGDLHGRKYPCWVSLIVALITHILLITSTNLKLSIGLFFIFGACCAGRYSTAYVYLCELMPKQHRDIVGSFV